MTAEERSRQDLQNEIKNLRRQVAESSGVDGRREAEVDWQVVFEGLGDAVFIADTDTGIIVGCNTRAEALLGRSRDEIIGMHQTQLHPPGQEEQRRRDFREHVGNGEALAESEVAASNGCAVPVSISASVVILDGKKRILGIFRDITARKRAEEALRKSEAKFRNVVGSAPLGIHMYRLESEDRLVFMDANPAADMIIGVDNSQFIGKTIEEAFPLLVNTEVPEAYRRVAATGESWHTEQIDYEDDFIGGAYEVHAFQTTPGNMAAMFLDITERIRAEKALHESEESLAEAQSIAHLGHWRMDPKTGVVVGSDELFRIFGFGREDASLDAFTEVVHPDDREHSLSHFRRGMEHGESWDIEHRLVRKDGTQKTVHVIGEAITDDAGTVVALVGTVQDITERKRAEEEVRKQNEFLEHVLGSLTHPFHVIDAQSYTVLLANDAARMGDLSESTTCFALTHRTSQPCQSSEHPCPLEEVKRTGKPAIVQHVHYDKNGDARQLEIHGYPIFDDDGNVIQMIEYGLDVTDRMRAEEELQAAFVEIKGLKDQLEAENVYLRKEVESSRAHSSIVAQSDTMRRVLEESEQVAATSSTVLLQGETGTGKELIARAIHDMSPRKGRPMIAVNCAAMPSTLVENELFGHEKGAYTGALTKQMGRFELANDSTIFLDEVGELSPEIQGKLLRVIQEGTFERLGSPDTIKVNVRVIAATNRDLSIEVEKGRFREDLYYRLNVFPVMIPPLRERGEDIPSLTWAFVEEFAERMGKRIESIPPSAMEALQSYSWPGNVRELRNVIERAMILSTGGALRAEVPGSRRHSTKTLQDVEREHVRAVLETTGGRIRGEGGAAELLGLKPTTLAARIKKLRIPRET